MYAMFESFVLQFEYSGTKNKAGETPLSLASAGGHLDTVKYLIEKHHCDPRCETISICCNSVLSN